MADQQYKKYRQERLRRERYKAEERRKKEIKDKEADTVEKELQLLDEMRVKEARLRKVLNQ